MAQTLSDIKNLLAAHGLHPKKRFGQNFLHDGNHMQRIMQAADISPGQLVLEVGPGTGALTETPARSRRNCPRLSKSTTTCNPSSSNAHNPTPTTSNSTSATSSNPNTALNPEVIERLQSFTHTPHPKTQPPPFKLIANLPYNIASPLLINLAVDHPQMTTAIIMVQREVADRITAKPSQPSGGGGKDYGPLSVILQAMCEVAISSARFPPPASLACAEGRFPRSSA